VSNNTALKELNCDDNQLTATTLNNLFQTLHSNTVEEEKIIRMGNNPGTSTCNKNIAERKGWEVRN